MDEDAAQLGGERAVVTDLTRGEAARWLIGQLTIVVSVLLMGSSWPGDVLNYLGATGLTIGVSLILLGYVLPRARRETSWAARWSRINSLGWHSGWDFRAQNEEAALRLDLPPTIVRVVLEVAAVSTCVLLVMRLLSFVTRDG